MDFNLYETKMIGSSYISHCTADIVYKADMFYLLKDILLKKEITTLKEE